MGWTKAAMALAIGTAGAAPAVRPQKTRGDKYVAARGSEFGYANYEVEQLKQ